MSTFDGYVKEFPCVSVDYFGKSNYDCTAFFLSHCHTDHMRGLFECGFMNHLRASPDAYLYCSEVSKIIIESNGLHAVRDKIVALPIQKSTMIQVYQPNGEPLDVLVSTIPAGHCPGSVMFLFEGLNANVLYTGDFRLLNGDIGKFRQLHSTEGVVKPIDSLYIDTTFFSKRYAFFPSRKISLDLICHYVQLLLDKGKNVHVNFTVPARYGSEYVFIYVSRTLGMKIHIPEEKYLFYKSVPEIIDAVTNTCDSTRIHCFYKLSDLKDQLDAHGLNDAIIKNVKPAALSFPLAEFKHLAVGFPDSNPIRICYSSHSSYKELEEVILHLKPRTIIPCVISPNKITEVTALIHEICDAEVRIQMLSS